MLNWLDPPGISLQLEVTICPCGPSLLYGSKQSQALSKKGSSCQAAYEDTHCMLCFPCGEPDTEFSGAQGLPGQPCVWCIMGSSSLSSFPPSLSSSPTHPGLLRGSRQQQSLCESKPTVGHMHSVHCQRMGENSPMAKEQAGETWDHKFKLQSARYWLSNSCCSNCRPAPGICQVGDARLYALWPGFAIVSRHKW